MGLLTMLPVLYLSIFLSLVMAGPAQLHQPSLDDRVWSFPLLSSILGTSETETETQTWSPSLTTVTSTTPKPTRIDNLVSWWQAIFARETTLPPIVTTTTTPTTTTTTTTTAPTTTTTTTSIPTVTTMTTTAVPTTTKCGGLFGGGLLFC